MKNFLKMFLLFTLILTASAFASGGLYSHITTATDTIAASNAGAVLHSVTLNTYVASETIKLYDIASTSCTGTPSGTLIGTITMPSTITSTAPITLIYDATATNGVCVVTSSTADVTVVTQ